MAARSQRGAATFVMAAVIAVVVFLAVAGLLVGGYLVAAHRARAAADLAALSGAAAYAQGAPVCPVIRRIAADNRAEVVGCGQVGDQLDFVVTARVRVRVDIGGSPFPRYVDAVAYAGSATS